MNNFNVSFKNSLIIPLIVLSLYTVKKQKKQKQKNITLKKASGYITCKMITSDF